MGTFVASHIKKRRIFYKGGAPKLPEKKLLNVFNVPKINKIGLFLNDKQFIEGTLIEEKEDHLIVEVNQQICYIPLQYIHVITKNSKEFALPTTHKPYIDKNKFADVLDAVKNHWVVINGFSTQVFSGVLSRILKDHIMLINNQELLYMEKTFITYIYSNITKEHINMVNSFQNVEILNKHQERLTTDSSSILGSHFEQYNSLFQRLYDNKFKNDWGNLGFPFFQLEEIEQPNKYEVLVPISNEFVEKNDTQFVEEKNDNNFEHKIEKLEQQVPIMQNLSEDSARKKEKRILLTAWSSINHDQSTVARPKSIKEPLVEFSAVNANSLEPSYELNETLPKDENTLQVDEKATLTTVELTPPIKPENRITPKEELELIEKQYYALMNYAAKHSINPKVNKEKIEKQYYSLMRHAAKMYRLMRDE